MVPGQGIDLDLHVQSVASCRLDDPGPNGETDDSLGISQTMFSKPLAYSSALDRRPARRGRRPTWRSFGARFPDALGKRTCQSARTISCAISSAKRRVIFLSQAGPRFVLDLLQAEHHLWFLRCRRLQTTKATRLGRPRLAWYAARASSRASQRGLGRNRAGASNRSCASTASRRRMSPFRLGTVWC